MGKDGKLCLIWCIWGERNAHSFFFFWEEWVTFNEAKVLFLMTSHEWTLASFVFYLILARVFGFFRFLSISSLYLYLFFLFPFFGSSFVQSPCTRVSPLFLCFWMALFLKKWVIKQTLVHNPHAYTWAKLFSSETL